MRQILLGAAVVVASVACADSRPTSPSRAPAKSVLRDVASGPRCHAVQGSITERITGPNTAAGTVTGDISGDVSIMITQLQQLPGGQVTFQGQCTMLTANGTLTTNDDAQLSPIDAPLYRVNNHLHVSGGTGQYAGATGNLHTHGTVNFVPGGLVDLRYSGEVCDGDPNE
jgi:hypothetical protein